MQLQGRRTINHRLLLVACICFVGGCLFISVIKTSSSTSSPSEVNYNLRSLKSDGLLGEDVTEANIEQSLDYLISSMEKNFYSHSDLKVLSQKLAAQISDYVLTKLSQAKVATPYGNCWSNNRERNVTDLPVIYVVTPTFRRPEQIPDLTRFAQTLLNVPAVHWIVVEDSDSTSLEIAKLLSRYGIPFTHLNARMPAKYQKAKVKPRGVSNRNAGLEWIRHNAQSGVVYFADDDNSYDLRLFEEMRYTKKVSMWPVGLVTKVALSSPVVQDGKVVDFFDGWIVNRKFPVDMAGFAVSVQLIKENSDINMPYVPGYEEDGFLKNLGITKDDIEPKANNCTTILVWHTQTKKNDPADRKLAADSKYKGTNIEILQDSTSEHNLSILGASMVICMTFPLFKNAMNGMVENAKEDPMGQGEFTLEHFT